MLRQILVTAFVVTSTFACKPRSDSTLQSEAGQADETQRNLNELWLRFDNDIKIAEDYYLATIDDDDRSPYTEGLALSTADNIALAKAASSVSARLKLAAKETPADKRSEIEGLALELDTMAALLEADLPGVDAQRIAAAVARATTLLDKPGAKSDPALVQKPAPDKPQPVVPTPDPEPVKQTNYDDVTCARYGSDTFLPQGVESGITFGALGFHQYKNCVLAANNVKNGLVCSVSPKNKVSPFRTSNGQLFGPPVGFEQTINCINAVSRSTRTICLVDNSQAGSPYAKYDIATGNFVDYWFDTLDKCIAGDKSPDPREECLRACERRYDACQANAKRYTGMDKTSKSLECMLANMKERDRC